MDGWDSSGVRHSSDDHSSSKCLQLSNGLAQGHYSCLESLSLLNATTGEVITIGEGRENTDDEMTAPNWSNIVSLLINKYPNSTCDFTGCSCLLNESLHDAALILKNRAWNFPEQFNT